MIAWLNGRLVDLDEAKVSVLDHGFTVGDGVFETLKVVSGVPFALSRHVERLQRSAAIMSLPPLDPEFLTAAMGDCVAANGSELGEHGRLRVTYSSGPGPLGSDRGDSGATLAVVAVAGAPWPASTAVVTVDWPRNERGALAGVKSTSYGENALALARAKESGAGEAIVFNTVGQLCEGTGSNIFLVRDGEILTPALASGCLAGITRALVLEWSHVTEAILDAGDLLAADEVFITSSTRDVHPVHRVDDRDLPVGPVTTEVAETFRRRSAAHPDP